MERIQDPKRRSENAAEVIVSDGAGSVSRGQGLGSLDPATRRQSIQQLLQRMDPQAVRKLLPMLEDPDTEVRQEAVQALKVYGWKPSTDQERVLQAMATGRYEDVLALGAAAAAPLMALLKQSMAGHRLAALELLLQLEEAPKLDAVMVALNDEDSSIRLVAVHAAVRVAEEEAGSLLAGMLSDPSPEVRADVLDIVAQSDLPDRTNLITKAFADPLPEIRRRAVEWLGQTGDMNVLPALTHVLFDESDAVRATSLSAMERLAPGWERSDLGASIIHGLEASCRNGPAERRLAAREVLKQLGISPTYAPGGLSQAQLAAIMALSGALQAPNRDLRQAAVEALGNLGDARAIAPLIKALQDPDVWVRRAGVHALNALKWEPANYPNLARQAVILHRWDVVTVCGEAAVPPLLLALDSESPAAQVSIMQCLGRINSLQAVEPLTQRLTSESRLIRRAAAQALADLGWQTNEPSLAVRQAIALERWEEASRFGACSVELLVQAAKESAPESDHAEAALKALTKVADPQAADSLMLYSRDGQVAEAVVKALHGVLENKASQISATTLSALAELNGVIQFQYAFDKHYGAQVRASMRELDTSAICEMAQRELVRRLGSTRPRR